MSRSTTTYVTALHILTKLRGAINRSSGFTIDKNGHGK